MKWLFVGSVATVVALLVGGCQPQQLTTTTTEQETASEVYRGGDDPTYQPTIFLETYQGARGIEFFEYVRFCERRPQACPPLQTQ